jgi:hypothetical protein
VSPTDLSAVVPSVTHRIRARHQPLLGGLLVKEGLINQVQLDRVLALQQEMEPRPLLGQLLVDHRLVTPHELNAVLSKYNREHLLGDVLIETRVISPAQLETALAVQRKSDAPLGETLIQLGFITERQLKHALSIQLRIAFVDLDDRAIDPELAALISESYARHHRVMPIARADDRIVLAMADPTDVERITELRSCTGHGIDVVAATTDALERALARAYGGARSDAPSPLPSPAETPETATRAATDRVAPERYVPEPDRRAPAGPALAAVRARIEPLRLLTRNWERWADSVEGLLGERLERRGELARLAVELQDSRAAHARVIVKLEAKTEALTRLEAAHAALVQEREALRSSLAELHERHAAALHDRQFVIEHLEAVLQRLRP